MKCKNCGAEFSGGQSFCNMCGSALTDAAPKKCPRCGADVEANSAFCTECGYQLNSVNTQQPDAGYTGVQNTVQPPAANTYTQSVQAGDVKQKSKVPMIVCITIAVLALLTTIVICVMLITGAKGNGSQWQGAQSSQSQSSNVGGSSSSKVQGNGSAINALNADEKVAFQILIDCRDEFASPETIRYISGALGVDKECVFARLTGRTADGDSAQAYYYLDIEGWALLEEDPADYYDSMHEFSIPKVNAALDEYWK